MFCGECGKKNKEGATFCEKCGNKLETVKEPVVKQQLSKKQKTVLIIIVAVIAVLGICYKVGSDLTSPKAVADKYLKALSNNDYNAIYSYLDIEGDDTFVSKKIYSDLMKENDTKNSIEQYKITEVEENDLSAVVRYKYTTKKSTSEETARVNLIKQKGKKFLIFDNWKVGNASSSSDMITKDYTIKVDKGSKVVFGDVLISEKYLDNENSSSSQDVYVLPQVFAFETNVKVTLKNGFEFEKKIKPGYYSTAYLEFDDDLLTAKQKDELVDNFKTIISQIYTDAIAGNKFEAVESKYKRENLDLTNLTKNYDNFVNTLADSTNKLTSINFKDGTIYSIYLDDDGYFKVDIKFTYDYTVEYTNYDDEVVSVDKNTSDYFVLILGYNDAKYYLVDINNIETYFSRY